MFVGAVTIEVILTWDVMNQFEFKKYQKLTKHRTIERKTL